MLQLPSGDQHEREFSVRAFVGRNDVCRHQLDAPCRGRKGVNKHGGLTRVFSTQARIGHAGFAFESLPGDAPNGGMHGLAHFFVHRRHTIVFAGVMPRQAEAVGQLLKNPQIWLGLAGRRHGLLAHLHHAVGVADGAGFFRPGGGGQHHIGQPRRFSHENVLHHEVVQTGQGVPGMVQVRIAHGGVFAHHVHAANLVRVAVVGQRLVHDLDHGVARLVVQLGVPEVFKPGVVRCVVNALVVGKHHGDQTGITGALHVVLAAQRVQARARLADLAGHRNQRDQAAGVVGAMHMLADAHAPQDHRAFGLGKFTCHFPQRVRRNAADGRHGLWAVGLDVVAQRFVIAGAGGDEVMVHQTFVDHGVNQCVEHGHICVGFELQGTPGVFANVGHTRVSQHNFGTAFGGVFHPGCGHRMVGCGVGANHQDQPGVFDVVDLVAHRARPHALQQRCDAGGMTQTGAMVHVVAAKTGAHQLLEQVGFFVAAFGRAKTRQRLVAKGVAQAGQFAATQVERFFPGGFPEHV